MEDFFDNSLFDEPVLSAEKAWALKYGGRDENPMRLTEAKVVKRVYALGRALSRVFEDTGLNYWCTAGTLLGAVRHRGLIPWDDDLDICLLDTHLQTFHKCRQILQR